MNTTASAKPARTWKACGETVRGLLRPGRIHTIEKTAAVIVAVAGDPRNYASAAAFVKSLGLNLKEHSSGESKGGLHITKRGPGIVRMMLYMAVLRLIQTFRPTRWCGAGTRRRSAGWAAS